MLSAAERHDPSFMARSDISTELLAAERQFRVDHYEGPYLPGLKKGR
jgi:hypothetical protein